MQPVDGNGGLDRSCNVPEPVQGDENIGFEVDYGGRRDTLENSAAAGSPKDVVVVAAIDGTTAQDHGYVVAAVGGDEVLLANRNSR